MFFPIKNPDTRIPGVDTHAGIGTIERNASNHEPRRRTMETARKALESMKKGTVTTLWGYTVARIGDRYLVGESIRLRDATISIEQAAMILAQK
jgi:hypothetical protein